ncbi:MAG: DUF3303 domain-containing protein [Candidatus Geothermincolia bacterium]
MKFCSILTWEPDKRNEIIARRSQSGSMLADGINLIGEWIDLAGNRDIVVFETDDPRDMVTSALAWNDILTYETFPVLEAEAVMDSVVAERETVGATK